MLSRPKIFGYDINLLSAYLTTYQALLELRDAGFVKSIRVCNYGIGPLREIPVGGRRSTVQLQ